MQRSTVPPHLQRDLGIGNRLNDPALQSLILSQVERLLDAEVKWQNHLTSSNSVGSQMQEVRDLANGMKDIIASLKRTNVAAKEGLMSEVTRSKVNAQKVKSFTKELSDANKEVEAFLGDTGSNFPSSEDLDTQPQDGRKAAAEPTEQSRADANGVMLNRG